jgi:hypothetical protein
MIRIITLLSLTVLISLQINAQIVITSGDMPVPGDTIRKSNTVILDGINYEQAGPDQTWMFDQLTVMTQQIDTFVNVSETPSVYQFFFNNQFIYPDYKATVAQKLGEFTAIPTVTLTDSYLFIKNSNADIREVGYGVTLAGVPLPIQFQQIDTIYRFPLEYGDIDSAHAHFEIDVPNLGFLMISRFRRNTVDGWGTLTTPYGEFQTLRVKTEIEEYDSIYSDSLGVGIPVTRNIIEYKWLANGYHEPILLVSAEGPLVSASYIDSVRYDLLAVPEVDQQKFEFSLYPNPCKDYLSVSYELPEDADVSLSIYSVYGSEMIGFSESRQARGSYKMVLNLKKNGFSDGIYLARLIIGNTSSVKRIVVN